MYVSIPKLSYWNLAPNMMVLGGAFKKWLVIDRVQVLIKKKIPESSLIPSTMWSYSKKMAIYEPGRELSLDIESAGTLILTSQLPELWQTFLI